MQPMLSSGTVASFMRKGMWRPQTIVMGSRASVKSERMLSAEYAKVTLMMKSTGMQLPSPCAAWPGPAILSQKYVTGRHCSSMAKKKVMPVAALTNMVQ